MNIRKLMPDGAARPVARRARIRRAGDLRAPQGARHVRAPGEAQRRARFARDGMGPPAARTELLVLACVRRARRQHQAADELCRRPATCGSCGREAALERKRHAGEELSLALRRRCSDSWCWAPPRSRRARWSCSCSITAFSRKQGDERSMRVVKIAAHRGAITDRSGEPLAVSTPVDSVWVNPQELNDNIDQLPKLAKALKEDQQIVGAAHHQQSRSRIPLPGARTCRPSRRRTSRRWEFRACICCASTGATTRPARWRATWWDSRPSTTRARRAWSSATTSC